MLLPIRLCAQYATRGTELGSDATRACYSSTRYGTTRTTWSSTWMVCRRAALSARCRPYPPTRLPVLTQATKRNVRYCATIWCYAMRSDMWYWATVWCYAMHTALKYGTMHWKLQYSTTRHAVLKTAHCYAVQEGELFHMTSRRRRT
eukprot:890680-Rhodomonas_salina.1